MQKAKIKEFQKIVWNHYRNHGRHDLPWRHVKKQLPERERLYRILVSEIMLQQTQVERVLPYYKAWLQKFPTAKILANSSLSDVLKAWQGLGYNRRARNLYEASKILARRSLRSVMGIEELQKLPGVGVYTARAVGAFAYNHDVIFIETNIRTAILHYFFVNHTMVHDKHIQDILKELLPKGRAREWYGALMDYGAYLKGTGVRLNAKSKHYTKQSKFKGSDREARGAILKALAVGGKTKVKLGGLLGKERTTQLHTQVQKLMKEGLVMKTGARYHLPH